MIKRNEAILATQEDDDLSPVKGPVTVPQQPKAPKGLKSLSIVEAMKTEVWAYGSESVDRRDQQRKRHGSISVTKKQVTEAIVHI